jgi:N-acetylmuramic acid 6-phosphate (MurNAc-6-P) etherase
VDGLAGGSDALTTSIEGAEDDADTGQRDLHARALTAADVVVGIAASGRTPYVLAALRYAAQIGAPTVGIAGSRSDRGQHPVEGGDIAKNDAQHDKHGSDDPTWQGVW